MEEIEQLKEENAKLKEKFASYESHIKSLEEANGLIMSKLAEKEQIMRKLAKDHEDIIRLVTIWRFFLVLLGIIKHEFRRTY